MIPLHHHLSFLTAALGLISGGAWAAPAGSIAVAKQDQGYAFSEAGKPVLFYQIARKDLDGKAARSNYVHPLHDLDGNVITEDFPADHVHHRGIFWAWHQVLINGRTIQDSWINQDSFWEVQSAAVAENRDSASLSLVVHWESPQFLDPAGKRRPFVREDTTVRVHRREGDLRKVDFHIALKALVDGVEIGGANDDKGYGGFSPRIRLPADIRFVGQQGEVTPRTTAVDASPWMDMSGTFAGSGRSGVTVLTHPTTTGFPQKWILRKARSMQNPMYPGRKPVALAKEQPLLLRYRLVLHRGELAPARIEALQAEYARERLN